METKSWYSHICQRNLMREWVELLCTLNFVKFVDFLTHSLTCHHMFTLLATGNHMKHVTFNKIVYFFAFEHCLKHLVNTKLIKYITTVSSFLEMLQKYGTGAMRLLA